MISPSNQLNIWKNTPEGSQFEVKEAKNNFETESLIKICCALGNEGGGHCILGMSDTMPRTIVGSKAFLNLEKIKSDLMINLRIRIEVVEMYEDSRRVVVFTVPSRPIGVPIQYQGIYWMRRGAELVHMTPDMLKRIFDEGVTDFSAQICPDASFEDLDLQSINNFRDAWVRKSGNNALNNIPNEHLLEDIEVITDEGITYAALILFGTGKALGKYLAQSEAVFEYRSSDTTGPAQQRIEYRQGFFSFYNDLWEKINLRNDTQHFQDGLFIWDIPTFNERAIREIILNAVSHRDYKAPGSVWVKQYPRKITISSPGGFPPGISPQNILWKQQPRNRRIAEVFAKCGLVERAGQGADRIFEESIKQAKALPDFSRTDDHEVVLTLDGQVQDESFLRFLEKVGEATVASFTTVDFLVLDLVHKEQTIPSEPSELKMRLKRLIDLGIVESLGRGKGARYMLCKNYYMHTKQSGIYTRKRGLDKETNKQLLLKHIRENREVGSKLRDLRQVLPSLSERQVQGLMRELRGNGDIYFIGKTNASVWFPGKRTEEFV